MSHWQMTECQIAICLRSFKINTTDIMYLKQTGLILNN